MSKSPIQNKKTTNPRNAGIDVSKLHEAHPKIRAQDWRSPLVFRLLRNNTYRDGAADLSDSFRAPDLNETKSQLPLHWSGLKEDFDQCINTYQDPILSEFATLGLACILLTRHTNFRISEVTRRGERVDYWIGDERKRKRFVLEVGGQQAGSLEGLSTDKTQQLKNNPWGQDGFICVAVYEASLARLWFCKHGGTT